MKKSVKVVSILLCVFTILLSFCACSSQNDEITTTKSSSSSSSYSSGKSSYSSGSSSNKSKSAPKSEKEFMEQWNNKVNDSMNKNDYYKSKGYY